MSRPFIDFIRVDDIQQRAVTIPGCASSILAQTLSSDAANGGKSLVVSIPADWSLPAGRCDGDVEIFVLEGRISAGATELQRYGYVFIPAGQLVPGLRTLEPTRILAFTESDLTFTPGEIGRDPDQTEPDLTAIHLSEFPWQAPTVKGFPAGGGRKTLRVDAQSGQSTWVLGVLPHWDSPFEEWHEFSEEIYLLQGDIETSFGLMTAGSYLSHPAGVESIHGPMRSRSGMLLFNRAKGPIVNTYIPVEQPQFSGEWP